MYEIKLSTEKTRSLSLSTMRCIKEFKCSAAVDEKIVTTAELMCTQKAAD
jgi:3-hydroxymyristoyl/3-hydroxydecanoyl-(acyl carrier protein) dehydratase